MYTKLLFRISLVSILCAPLSTFAWGRRGHQIVAETAAYLNAQDPKGEFLRGHSFDLGYYANVPDFGWKRPATYADERPQHYMDMEIFERAFAKHPEIKDPFSLSRAEFDKAFPEAPQNAGRSFWRIREMYAELEKTGNELKAMKPDADLKPRQALQLRWLLLAGFLAHYVGDMSMPLHATENHNGEMTNQKGVHAYYEDTIVDKLYPELSCEVNKEATKQFPAFTKKNKDKPLLVLMKELADKSLKNVPTLLALDKRMDRKAVDKNVKIYHAMIKANLVMGSLYLAELYRRQIGFDFNDTRFYDLEGEPKFIPPPGAPAATPEGDKK